MIKSFQIDKLFKHFRKLNHDIVYYTIKNYLANRNISIDNIFYHKNCRFNQRLLNIIRKKKHKKLVFDSDKDIIIIYTDTMNIVYDLDNKKCEMIVPSVEFVKYLNMCVNNFYSTTNHFIDRLIERSKGRIKSMINHNLDLKPIDLLDKVIWYIFNNTYFVKRKDSPYERTIYRCDGYMIYVIENDQIITCYELNDSNRNKFVREKRNHGKSRFICSVVD